MHWTNIGLILVAGLDLGMAFLMWLRNPKNKINISFALSFALAGIWTFGSAMLRESLSERSILYWGWVTDLFGALSLIPLFFFSLYYPFQKKKLSISKMFLIFASIMGIILVVFYPNAWFGRPFIIDPPNSAYKIMPGYLYFILFYFFYAVWILHNLIIKHKEANGQQRKQMGLILLGLGSIFFAAGIASVVWPMIDASWRYWHWIGPYMAIVVLVFVAYILFFQNRK